MPIPKIETPKYKTVLPSDGREIEYRPFLVKEEKILLIAQESQDTKDIAEAMIQIINNCTFDKVDASKLSQLDFQYLFLQLRIKSVGETSSFKIKCEECGEENNVVVDLRTAEIEYPEETIEDVIQITDTVGVKLRRGSIFEFAGQISVENNIADNITSMIRGTIESIYDENDVYPIESVSDEDFLEFADSMTHNQLEHINKYIENEPQVVCTVKFKCVHCGHENEIKIKGSQSFFL